MPEPLINTGFQLIVTEYVNAVSQVHPCLAEVQMLFSGGKCLIQDNAARRNAKIN